MTASALRLLTPLCTLILLYGCGGSSSNNAPAPTPPPPPPPPQFTVTATAGAGGTISPASAQVNQNATTSFTVTANAGFAIASVSGCGGSLSGGTYTTAAITANCTVTAAFTLTLAAPTGVSASAGDGQVTVAWTAAAQASGYNLYIALSANIDPADPATYLNRIEGAVSPATVSALTNGTAYFFGVTSTVTGGESALSSVVTATPAGAGAGGATTLVSRSDAGAPANVPTTTAVIDTNASMVAMSFDGRLVAFTAESDNLVAGDTNGEIDVFVHDRQAGSTTRVSVSSSGTEGNGRAIGAGMSADGRFVAFRSTASNLVDGDTNNTADIFLRDLQNQVTERVSVRADGSQSGPDLDADRPSVSADGRFVAFAGRADALINDSFTGRAVFVRDRQAATTTLVSVAGIGPSTGGAARGLRPVISGDGRYVAFESDATNLLSIPGAVALRGNVFVRDLQTSQTVYVSVSLTGGQANGSSLRPDISADGRYVVFTSAATNLVADTDGLSSVFRVYLRDLQTEETVLISRTTAGAPSGGPGLTGEADYARISADGRYVLYESTANNLVDGDTNDRMDVFLFDRETGTTTRVSLTDTDGEIPAPSNAAAIAGDGSVATFVTIGTGIVGGVSSPGPQLYARELEP